MSDPFRSPHLLLQQAEKEHLKLQQQMDKWVAKSPYALRKRADEDHNQDVYELHLPAGLPDEFSLAGFNLATSLRAALDQAVHACADVLGAPKERNRHFPFGKTIDDVERALTSGQSRNAPEPIKDTLRSLRPFENGSAELWALNQMRNIHSHQALIRPSLHTNGSNIVPRLKPGQTSWSFPGVMEFTTGPWQSETSSFEILRCTPNIDAWFDIRVATYLALDHAGSLTGRPIVEAFSTIGVAVAKAVDAIQTKTASLV